MLLQPNVPAFALPAGSFQPLSGPVSYTHLDVYKRQEAFWLALQPDSVHQYQAEMESHGELRVIGWADLERCADILARIIDAKSPYTEQHSRGVSQLSRHLAEKMGFDAITCAKIGVAGLLHDIGKLQIPDEIIEGRSTLTAHEFDIMKSHSYATRQVLKRLHAIEEISRWASWHHETPDGHGYPFHTGGCLLYPPRCV